MNNVIQARRPPGWSTITPRLLTHDVSGLVAFLRAAFDARGEFQLGRPTELRIGDSMLMVSDGGGVRDAMPAFLHLFVCDADAIYAQAIAAGAQSIEAPSDMPYGDRRATVSDAWDNLWQIAVFQGAKGRSGLGWEQPE
jgi:PhnB protein